MLEELPPISPANLQKESPLGRDVEQAMRRAIGIEEFRRIVEAHDRIAAGFLRGDISWAEYEDKTGKHSATRGTLECADADKLAAIMETAGVSAELIKEAVEHEQAHFKAAEEAGFAPRYRVSFARYPDGTSGCFPHVFFDLPA